MRLLRGTIRKISHHWKINEEILSTARILLMKRRISLMEEWAIVFRFGKRSKSGSNRPRRIRRSVITMIYLWLIILSAFSGDRSALLAPIAHPRNYVLTEIDRVRASGSREKFHYYELRRQNVQNIFQVAVHPSNFAECIRNGKNFNFYGKMERHIFIFEPFGYETSGGWTARDVAEDETRKRIECELDKSSKCAVRRKA